ncbi:MAG: two-component system response regulator [Paenibacillaceae bacterium]|nr:two-component system response regulator [Paenibacillaceae bacterium]
MWKVLLVEDETFVRRKLRKLVNWEELGYTVCGEAANGQEALEQMKTLRPDLVLADIAMPVMNGLELLEASREAGLDSKFIMLTCMNEFEYARRALELGASGYILKLSMSITGLQEALAKAGAELGRNRMQQELALSRAFDRYYAQALRLLQSGESAEAADTAMEAISSLRLSMGAPPLKQVAVVTVFGDETAGLAEEWLARSIISPKECVWKSALFHKGITTLLFWSEDQLIVDIEAVKVLGFRGLISRPFFPRHLLRRWQDHFREMNAVWYEDTPGIKELMSPSSKEADRARVFIPSWEMEREIIAAFGQLQVNTVNELLRGYWHTMRERQAPVEAVRDAAGRLINMFASIVSDTGAVNSGELMGSSHSHAELLAMLSRQAGEWSASLARTQVKLTDHPEINRILEYCRQHYSSNISLKGMAAMVRMEEHYLSRLFRQKTEDSLINYVQTLRLEKAKELLAQTSHPVAEIGRSVGFPSENYFAKTFRKRYGQTPSQYRKEHMAGDKA